MALLIVQNGFKAELPGLGKNKFISDLSEKRITKAVREKLRTEYGLLNVIVSCEAYIFGKTWHGRCTINDVEFKYEIKQHPLT